MENQNDTKQTLNIRIPFSTILVVLATLIAICIIKTIAPLLMSLFLAILLAVSLHPIVRWFESKKVPRYLAILFLAVVMAGCMTALVATVLPRLIDQLSEFMQNLPKFKAEILQHFSTNNPMRPFVEKNISKQALLADNSDYSHIFVAGNMVLQATGKILLVFTFTIYLLVDGPRMVEWLGAFFPLHTQAKIKKTGQEVSLVIFSYVGGQFVTSVLSFIYVFFTMWALNVPNKLLLATLAGVFDVLPVLGFFIAVVPAILFAVTVSAKVALIVVGLYILYHAIENYVIIPAIYGNRLRVSSFVVLVSLIAAWMIAGVEGAIAVLPIVASYPIVEKIWLKRFVGSETVAEHASK